MVLDVNKPWVVPDPYLLDGTRGGNSKVAPMCSWEPFLSVQSVLFPMSL